MSFITKLVYYCLLSGTAFLSVFYVYEGIFKSHIGDNPYHMKAWFAFSSLFVFGFLYKAYQVGELSHRFQHGIFIILASWLMWGLVLLAFLILAKLQGRI